jgi:hypothetical protein
MPQSYVSYIGFSLAIRKLYAWRSHNVVRGGTCRCTHLIVWKEYFAEARIKRIQYSKSVSNQLKTMLHTILNRKSSVNIIQSRLKNIFVTFSLSYIIFYLAFNCLYQKQRNPETLTIQKTILLCIFTVYQYRQLLMKFVHKRKVP